VKVSGFRVNFVQVCEWFDGCDKLRIIFKLRKKQDHQIVLYFKNCTTPRRLSLTLAMKSVYIAPKDTNNHHTYAKQIKVTA